MEPVFISLLTQAQAYTPGLEVVYAPLQHYLPCIFLTMLFVPCRQAASPEFPGLASLQDTTQATHAQKEQHLNSDPQGLLLEIFNRGFSYRSREKLYPSTLFHTTRRLNVSSEFGSSKRALAATRYLRGRNRTAERQAPCSGPELPSLSPPGRCCNTCARRADLRRRSGLGPSAPRRARTGSITQGRRRTRHLTEPQAEWPGSTTGKADATARP